jgi:hypothetical protein
MMMMNTAPFPFVKFNARIEFIVVRTVRWASKDSRERLPV